MSTKVIIKNARLSYPALFTPKAAPGSTQEKYSASLIIPKSDTETLNKIEAAIDAAKKQGQAEKFGGKLPANLKTPLRDGDAERPDDAAYKNAYFLNASSNNKPQVVDRSVKDITDATEVYAGCYVNVSVNFYPFNTSGNKGIAAGLGNVQKFKDGDALAGGAKAEDEFEVIDSSDEELDDIL